MKKFFAQYLRTMCSAVNVRRMYERQECSVFATGINILMSANRQIGSIPEGRTRSKLNPIRLPLQTPKPKRQETQRGYFMNKPGGMEAHHFVSIEWKLVHASPCYRPVLPSHFINI
ncbi:uncharacterized protein LOC124359356 [Homalodisca vitripennis]|uniref:uncharacterized protein LOC124359356 n=1 Tax=Homalodisca vitripennis TaxID=197043 RepID=UPI001EECAC6A|nr:uncharacterized protein LOC124359356 [Homalodisca vitripennis]KAG8301358.1 hypothetical protein J6590_055126 [Homalodisca vitripennis]